MIWSPEMHFERNTQQTNEQKNIRFGVAKEETFLAFFDATMKRMEGQSTSTEWHNNQTDLPGGKGVLKK